MRLMLNGTPEPEGNRPAGGGNKRTRTEVSKRIRSGCVLDFRLKVIEGKYGFAESSGQRGRPTRETETLENLSGGVRQMNCGDDADHAAVSVVT